MFEVVHLGQLYCSKSCAKRKGKRGYAHFKIKGVAPAVIKDLEIEIGRNTECPECGCNFEQAYLGQLYCSKKCAKRKQKRGYQYFKTHGIKPPMDGMNKQCLICGANFATSGPRTHCCSDECSKAHRQNFKRAAMIKWKANNPKYKPPCREISECDLLEKDLKKESRFIVGEIVFGRMGSAYIIKNCRLCGKEIFKPAKTTKYCSPLCRERAKTSALFNPLRVAATKISRNISSRICEYIRGKRPKSKLSVLPWTYAELMIHLEKLFEPGMTWSNYGTHWHIDHHVPLSWHDFTKNKAKAIKSAYSLSNLAPRWATTLIAISNGSKQIGNTNKCDSLCLSA